MTSKNVNIDSILRFVKQSIFSKRHQFYAKLDRCAQAHLAEPGKRIAWPDALSVLTDEDWAAAALTISDSVPLGRGAPLEPAYCACDDADPAQCYCRNGEVACRCDCHSEIEAQPPREICSDG